MNEITFEKAKEIADNNAKEHGKIVVKITENDEYWKFEAGFEDGHRDFDSGIGGIYISKKDGSIRGLQPWDMEFTNSFNESSKEIYNFFDK